LKLESIFCFDRLTTKQNIFYYRCFIRLSTVGKCFKLSIKIWIKLVYSGAVIIQWEVYDIIYYIEPDITQESLLSHGAKTSNVISIITDCLPVFRRTGLGTCSTVWALDRLICEYNRSTTCPNCSNQYTCDRVQPIGFRTSRSTCPSDFYSPLARLNHNSKHEIINI